MNVWTWEKHRMTFVVAQREWNSGFRKYIIQNGRFLIETESITSRSTGPGCWGEPPNRHLQRKENWQLKRNINIDNSFCGCDHSRVHSKAKSIWPTTLCLCSRPTKWHNKYACGKYILLGNLETWGFCHILRILKYKELNTQVVTFEAGKHNPGENARCFIWCTSKSTVEWKFALAAICPRLHVLSLLDTI